ncbi:MAG TPA: aspartyl protease family protein [Thermoanaerobaculia bacterium]|nr:aspartyl protease family protein [Thermoanaerobaculia bacterium]
MSRERTRRAGLRRCGAALLLAALAACTTAPEVAIFALPQDRVRVPPPPGGFSAEERYQRGHYLEVQHYLESLPPGELEKSAVNLALYGKVLLARGDFGAAWEILEKARALEPRTSRRGEIEWALCQGAILWNDFATAEEYATGAVRDGYGLVPGFLRYLAALRDVDVYAGPAYGQSGEDAFEMRGFQLIRIPVTVNGEDSAAIVDSGAVYTILTQSFAREARVRMIPNSRASGRGLHKKEFPVDFGILAELGFGGLLLRDVPVMVMPDEAMLFETTRGQFPVPIVLGLHLLKEFRMRVDYAHRRVRWTRQDFRVPKTARDQNLFFHGGRVFARGSIDSNGIYQFLLDTGSEPTLLTTAGLARAGLPPSNKVFPKKVYGLGKTQVEWGIVSEVTLGIAGWGARFRDLAVKEDDSAFEDGILGTSLLGRFVVGMDFSRMVLTLENGS